MPNKYSMSVSYDCVGGFMNIKDLKSDYELSLHRPNRNVIGILTMLIDDVNIGKKIDDIDTISFNVSKDIIDRFTHIEGINKIYYEIKEERLVCLNNKEFYVIKNISESIDDTNLKVVECMSLEHKLTRINLTLEDVGLVLKEEDSDKDTISLETILENETGWKLNHIDNSVRYDLINGEYKPRMRWQESVSNSWYSFLTEEIAESFICIITFDTLNKEINIYDVNSYGENSELYLCKDNYIKSLEVQTSSNEIVTRLRLTGKDEIDIRGVNPFGTDYVEDYSYFINNGDMSDDLVNSLRKHTEIVEKNHKEWTKISAERVELNKSLIDNRAKLNSVCEKIKELISLKEQYESLNDLPNAEYIGKQIEEKNIEKNKLEQNVRNIESRLSVINEWILQLNSQLNRKIAVDENGNKIFSKKSLDELNEFLYYDSYVNNSFITEESLLEGGKVELSKRCIPTIEYNIDVQDFISRIINHRGKSFEGNLNLGDVIILYDEDLKQEFYLYLVGYEYMPEDLKLTLSLSNKKSKINNTKRIADRLKRAVNMDRYINSKNYIFNQIKYNKL